MKPGGAKRIQEEVASSKENKNTFLVFWGVQGKAREGVPRAPWGPPGFPLGPPGPPWVPLASPKNTEKTTFVFFS